MSLSLRVGTLRAGNIITECSSCTLSSKWRIGTNVVEEVWAAQSSLIFMIPVFDTVILNNVDAAQGTSASAQRMLIRSSFGHAKTHALPACKGWKMGYLI